MATSREPLHVSGAELRNLVSMPEAIVAVRAAFERGSARSADQPPRQGLADGTALAMMARGDQDSGTIVKVISIRHDNPRKGLPSIHALAVWFDGETGIPRLLVDGAALTALRTGAATGVATEALASTDASVLAVIGAGAQAADQIRGVCAVRNIREVRIASRSGKTASELATAIAQELPEVAIVSTSDISAAVANADVICTATNSTKPFLRIADISSRVHINAIGSYRAGMQELAPEVVASAALVVVDDVHAAVAEAGEVISALAAGTLDEASLLELGQITGRLTPPAVGTSIFKSVGIALQDWAIVQLVNERLSLVASP